CSQCIGVHGESGHWRCDKPEGHSGDHHWPEEQEDPIPESSGESVAETVGKRWMAVANERGAEIARLLSQLADERCDTEDLQKEAQKLADNLGIAESRLATVDTARHEAQVLCEGWHKKAAAAESRLAELEKERDAWNRSFHDAQKERDDLLRDKREIARE